MAAAFGAWADAGFAREAVPNPNGHLDWGVSWGTALGGTLAYERGYRDLWQHGRERVSPLSVILGMNNAASSHIAIQLGLGASCLSYTVACSSASAAIGEAFRLIRDGRAQLMMTGGSDAPLAYGVVRAWEALRVLAPGNAETSAAACKPFHVKRGGLVLGEGAAALVLEDYDHAVARGARIYAELAGYGSTSDHSHLVRPESRGQVRAINAALADGGLAPDDIDYINAHGTATREGDPSEIEAIRAVFGARAAELAVSATKSMHGHSMGATGAVEALATVMALHTGEVPPTAFLDEIDPACQGVRHVTGIGLRGVPLRAALSNSFAFGGSNAVLAFRRADA
jgi:3-oxoacyl-[acyl-carrier-protein] synthase II